jgi:hypothetical protein
MQEVGHNHGAVHVVVADPDVEEPGVVEHLLVEKRLDSHEEQVGLEGDLLDVKQRSCQTHSRSSHRQYCKCPPL